MNPAVVRATYLRRWESPGAQFLACMICPQCTQEHCFGITVRSVMNQHTWTCGGRTYRLDLLSTMQDLARLMGVAA